MNIGAVVLAAGGSSRLGEPKQLLIVANGETLVHRAVRVAMEVGAAPVILVVGAEADRVRAAVADLAGNESVVQIFENTQWSSGLSSSIHCGVRAALKFDASITAMLLLTCDMPSVGVNHLRTLCEAFNNGATRVASRYGVTRGIPAVLPKAEFNELLQLAGDKGAKALLMRDDTLVVALEDGTFDLDTPADVVTWRAHERRHR